MPHASSIKQNANLPRVECFNAKGEQYGIPDREFWPPIAYLLILVCLFISLTSRSSACNEPGLPPSVSESCRRHLPHIHRESLTYPGNHERVAVFSSFGGTLSLSLSHISPVQLLTIPPKQLLSMVLRPATMAPLSISMIFKLPIPIPLPIPYCKIVVLGHITMRRSFIQSWATWRGPRQSGHEQAYGRCPVG